MPNPSLCPRVQTLPLLYKQLTESGMPGSVPAVAVERGTTADQRVVFSPFNVRAWGHRGGASWE